MSGRPSILCPTDFSEASAGALRYAAAIAEHVAARLIVLWVEGPAEEPAKVAHEPPGRSGGDGPPWLTAARAANGLGDLSPVVSVSDARAGAAVATARCFRAGARHCVRIKPRKRVREHLVKRIARPSDERQTWRL